MVVVVGGTGGGVTEQKPGTSSTGCKKSERNKHSRVLTFFFFVCLTQILTYQAGILVHSCTTVSVHNHCDKDIGKEAQQLETAY